MPQLLGHVSVAFLDHMIDVFELRPQLLEGAFLWPRVTGCVQLLRLRRRLNYFLRLRVGHLRTAQLTDAPALAVEGTDMGKGVIFIQSWVRSLSLLLSAFGRHNISPGLIILTGLLLGSGILFRCGLSRLLSIIRCLLFPAGPLGLGQSAYHELGVCLAGSFRAALCAPG